MEALRIGASKFLDENDYSKMEILTLCFTILYHKTYETKSVSYSDDALFTDSQESKGKNDIFIIYKHLFTLARYDSSYSIREYVRFLRSIFPLENDPIPKIARNSDLSFTKLGLLFKNHCDQQNNQNDMPKSLSKKYNPPNLINDNFLVNSLSLFVGYKLNGYDDLPNWPEIQPKHTLRGSQTSAIKLKEKLSNVGGAYLPGISPISKPQITQIKKLKYKYNPSSGKKIDNLSKGRTELTQLSENTDRNLSQSGSSDDSELEDFLDSSNELHTQVNQEKSSNTPSPMRSNYIKDINTEVSSSSSSYSVSPKKKHTISYFSKSRRNIISQDSSDESDNEIPLLSGNTRYDPTSQKLELLGSLHPGSYKSQQLTDQNGKNNIRILNPWESSLVNENTEIKYVNKNSGVFNFSDLKHEKNPNKSKNDVDFEDLVKKNSFVVQIESHSSSSSSSENQSDDDVSQGLLKRDVSEKAKISSFTSAGISVSGDSLIKSHKLNQIKDIYSSNSNSSTNLPNDIAINEYKNGKNNNNSSNLFGGTSKSEISDFLRHNEDLKSKNNSLGSNSSKSHSYAVENEDLNEIEIQNSTDLWK
ncbi:hypothetical protein AYI68_g2597 [Smittium mucronatum]|uniref:Uncharacterized protein n=1 Tax=Smittium mucronatum TaxID=133383 RepID=A0A1R0H2A5_9FUNG|nr:hypothetical protein AYI68_g2597 [Smittium mucronatum]